MTKHEIIETFEEDFNDPGSIKSGEYLEKRILFHAQEIMRFNRSALVDVLLDWLALRTEPHTMLAVKIASCIHLHELHDALLILRRDILDGRVFLPFYTKAIDTALKMMRV